MKRSHSAKKFIIVFATGLVLSSLGLHLLSKTANMAVEQTPMYFGSAEFVAHPSFSHSLHAVVSNTLGQQSISHERINFTLIERVLASMQIDASGQVNVDAQLESTMSIASSSLSQTFKPAQLDHLRTLAIKSFPNDQGLKRINIFLAFHHYHLKAREQNLLPRREDLSVSEQMDWLAKIEALQLKTLGEHLSSQLYARQNTLARLILKMQLIDADSSLSEADKEIAMEEIQKQFEVFSQGHR